jgi:uncharacterized protein YbbC (DUF1343 family)
LKNGIRYVKPFEASKAPYINYKIDETVRSDNPELGFFPVTQLPPAEKFFQPHIFQLFLVHLKAERSGYRLMETDFFFWGVSKKTSKKKLW